MARCDSAVAIQGKAVRCVETYLIFKRVNFLDYLQLRVVHPSSDETGLPRRQKTPTRNDIFYLSKPEVIGYLRSPKDRVVIFTPGGD